MLFHTKQNKTSKSRVNTQDQANVLHTKSLIYGQMAEWSNARLELFLFG